MAQSEKPTCPECGSDNLVSAVAIGQTAETGKIGLSYRALLGLIGTEPIVADVCNSCGRIVRLYVKEVGKNWLTRR